jgi:hypothetical protein
MIRRASSSDHTRLLHLQLSWSFHKQAMVKNMKPNVFTETCVNQSISFQLPKEVCSIDAALCRRCHEYQDIDADGDAFPRLFALLASIFITPVLFWQSICQENLHGRLAASHAEYAPVYMQLFMLRHFLNVE